MEKTVKIFNLFLSLLSKIMKLGFIAEDVLEHLVNNLEEALKATNFQTGIIEGSSFVELSELDAALEKLGSPARIDTDIEGGSINISLDSNDMKYLSTIDKALEKFKSADTTASWISDNFKKLPWDTIKNKVLNTVIINHGETTPTQRDKMVQDMDKLGYRPLTVPELTALAIKRVDLFKKYPNPIFNSYIKHQLGSGLRTPYFDWNDKRKLFTIDVSNDWSDLNRFVFVRK